MSYTADDLKRERIEQLRHLATVQKVDGMLIQEWEMVALCDLALREYVPGEATEKNAFRYLLLRNGKAGDHAVVNGQLLRGEELDQCVDRFYISPRSESK